MGEFASGQGGHTSCQRGMLIWQGGEGGGAHAVGMSLITDQQYPDRSRQLSSNASYTSRAVGYCFHALEHSSQPMPGLLNATSQTPPLHAASQTPPLHATAQTPLLHATAQTPPWKPGNANALHCPCNISVISTLGLLAHALVPTRHVLLLSPMYMSQPANFSPF